MNRQIQKTGVRQWFGDDFISLQDELYTALEGVFAPYGDFIISGCDVAEDRISSGLVFIGGRICRFAGASGVSFPCYISLSETETNNRLYQDGSSKPTVKRYIAIYSVLQPSRSYIAINNENNTRFRDALEVSGYRFDDRLHITPPSTLNSPTIGDITIFDDTICIGKQGDEGIQYIPIVAKNAEKLAGKDVSDFITFETNWRAPIFNQGCSGNLRYRFLNGFIYLYGSLHVLDNTDGIIFTIPSIYPYPSNEIVSQIIDNSNILRFITITVTGEVKVSPLAFEMDFTINIMLPLN